ncbi:hypothetical protein A4E84_28655 [Streptomyces qaidamensis]|uniref:Uncharacterized protein n=1 Tax=Streptomyces qaidamensis TaxID=1783515 RepID=A0A143C6P6_9ACTN|nr:hypothetical protein [Streptomyces qaidamensis]AMW13117.1 hypothetical protein A4E84_28655 [Streptomyces qaidamensis]
MAKAPVLTDGPLRGTMVVRPDGYGPRGRMQAQMHARSKETGAPKASLRDAEGPRAPAELAGHAVTVRCPVAEGGSVPDADDAPGNVAVVARAY